MWVSDGDNTTTPLPPPPPPPGRRHGETVPMETQIAVTMSHEITKYMYK